MKTYKILKILILLLLLTLFSCKKNSNEILLKYDSEIIVLIDNKLYEDALALCDKMEKINSDYLPIYLYRGMIFVKIKHFENAEFEFTKILEKNEHINLWLPRQLITVYAWRSTARMEQHKYELAKSDAKKCISIYDNDSKGYYSLATIYYNNKEYEKALKVLNTMTSKFPDEFDTYYLRSIINYYLQNYEPSIADCNYVINNDPDEVRKTYYVKGLSNIAFRKFEQALSDLIRVQEIFPEENRFCYSIAFTYYKLGDIEKAKKYYFTTIETTTEAESNIISDLTYEFTEKKEVKEVFRKLMMER